MTIVGKAGRLKSRDRNSSQREGMGVNGDGRRRVGKAATLIHREKVLSRGLNFILATASFIFSLSRNPDPPIRLIFAGQRESVTAKQFDSIFALFLVAFHSLSHLFLLRSVVIYLDSAFFRDSSEQEEFQFTKTFRSFWIRR